MAAHAKRSLIKLKIAVFSPIPSANVMKAIAVNAGDLRSWRKANFRSFISFGAQCLNYIDAGSACRGSVDATTAAVKSTSAETTTGKTPGIFTSAKYPLAKRANTNPITAPAKCPLLPLPRRLR